MWVWHRAGYKMLPVSCCDVHSLPARRMQLGVHKCILFMGMLATHRGCKRCTSHDESGQTPAIFRQQANGSNQLAVGRVSTH